MPSFQRPSLQMTRLKLARCRTWPKDGPRREGILPSLSADRRFSLASARQQNALPPMEQITQHVDASMIWLGVGSLGGSAFCPPTRRQARGSADRHVQDRALRRVGGQNALPPKGLPRCPMRRRGRCHVPCASATRRPGRGGNSKRPSLQRTWLTLARCRTWLKDGPSEGRHSAFPKRRQALFPGKRASAECIASKGPSHWGVGSREATAGLGFATAHHFLEGAQERICIRRREHQWWADFEDIAEGAGAAD